ncbi:hypothetical protein C1X72_02085 [Pseudomonas sp. FW306-2-2C-D06B]|nr:hypothetical protein C1X72_02085 [Pseudomonas sp. FW306-2-2C-D06B]
MSASRTWKASPTRTTTASPPVTNFWCKKTNCNPETLKHAAKRLAAELHFSATEIMTMSYADMVWWLTD